MPEISVVVPFYKVNEKFLEKCIRSLIGQTERNIEILIVSDGATDSCIKKCKQFAEEDIRIKVIEQDNQGVAVARNNGLKQASSPYITFVDADDWVEPEFCQTFIKAFKENPDVEIISVAAFLNKEAEERKNPFWEGKEKYFVGKEKDQIQLQSIFKESSSFVPPFATFGTTWAKAYRRDWLIEQHIFYESELRRGQDTLFNLHALEKANKIYYIEIYLYHYRRNEGSTVNKYTDNVIEILEKISEYILQFITTYHKDERFYQAYCQKSIQLLSQAINCDYLHKENPKPYLTKRKELKMALARENYKNIFRKVRMENIPVARKLYWFLMRYQLADVIFLAHYFFAK